MNVHDHYPDQDMESFQHLRMGPVSPPPLYPEDKHYSDVITIY